MISIGIANSATNKIVQYKLEYYINMYCTEYSTKKITIEPALIKAIVYQECQGKPYSIRYEKHLKTNQQYVYNIPLRYREDKLSYCSLGASQVLYGTARWLGFRKEPAELLLSKHNIKYCIKYIKYLIERYWQIDKVISSYNQGSPRKNKQRKFKNQKYVNSVFKYYQKYDGKIKINE
jgi:hypothetical protein